MLMNKAVEVKTPAELKIMRHAGGIVGDILVLLKGLVKPGMSTGEIDRSAAKSSRSATRSPRS